MSHQEFIKRVEDFICEKCGTYVKGSGYTNHCPECLWSKHVDISPGDRAEECQGLMEPKYVVSRKGRWRIIHQCLKCGAWRICDSDSEDNQNQIIKLSTKPIPDFVLEIYKGRKNEKT